MQMDARRDELVAATLELFRERGISNTTIRDITDRVGVTRSLFYHYFPNKQAITDAVIDERVDDFVAHCKRWGEDCQSENVRSSLFSIVSLMRLYLLDSASINNRALSEQNAALWQQFTIRVAHRLAHSFEQRAGQPGTLSSRAHVTYPRESFYLLAVGLISLVSRNPDTTDSVIVDLIIETLHIS